MAEPVPLPPAGLSRTFYKRELPCPPAVEFSSAAGRQIFAAALAGGTMENYFKLAEQFRTQDEPAFCGLASVAMVLNSLAIDPRRAWKGPWRFFHEQMLDCCHPLEKVKEEGITLGQAACLARCNGARVEVYPHGSLSVQQFRGMVVDACTGGDHHLIVSYSRRHFLQTGDGHFSPIGGYSAAHDMVLILDTARFKYPPHWVPLAMLHEAMAHQDPATGQPRGFMRLGLHPRLDSVLFTLDLRDPGWRAAFEYVDQGVARAAGAAAALPGATPESVAAAAAAAAPAEAVRTFVAVRTANGVCSGGSCTQTAAIETFLHELRGMPLYGAVAAAATTRAAAQRGPSQPAGGSGKQGASRQPGVGAVPSSAAPEVPGAGRQAEPSAAAAAECPSPAPAVAGDLLPERLAMLLLLAPERAWQGVQPEALRRGVLALVDPTAGYKVVGIEAEYLRAQLQEVPAMRAALERAVEACDSAACQDAGEHTCVALDGGWDKRWQEQEQGRDGTGLLRAHA